MIGVYVRYKYFYSDDRESDKEKLVGGIRYGEYATTFSGCEDSLLEISHMEIIIKKMKELSIKE